MGTDNGQEALRGGPTRAGQFCPHTRGGGWSERATAHLGRLHRDWSPGSAHPEGPEPRVTPPHPHRGPEGPEGAGGGSCQGLSASWPHTWGLGLDSCSGGNPGEHPHTREPSS